jgi:hypothetical protein
MRAGHSVVKMRASIANAGQCKLVHAQLNRQVIDEGDLRVEREPGRRDPAADEVTNAQTTGRAGEADEKPVMDEAG